MAMLPDESIRVELLKAGDEIVMADGDSRGYVLGVLPSNNDGSIILTYKTAGDQIVRDVQYARGTIVSLYHRKGDEAEDNDGHDTRYAILNLGHGLKNSNAIIRHRTQKNLIWEIVVPDAGDSRMANLLVSMLNAQGSQVGQNATEGQKSAPDALQQRPV